MAIYDQGHFDDSGGGPDRNVMTGEPDHNALDVVVRAGDGHVLVTVQGEIDIATADQLGEALFQAGELARDRGGVVVVDLSAVSFMDSSGLNAMVRARNRTGVDWRLCGLAPRIGQLFRITGLDRMFPHHVSVAQVLGDQSVEP